jgi:tetratricopeptide (TPR) repeat protein
MEDDQTDIAAAEALLTEALDFFADGEDRRADILVDRAIKSLRLLAVGADRVQALRLWAIALSTKEEWEQVLLKYEQILSIHPDDEDALWQSVQVLLRSMEKPEPARTLLVERLLPLHRTDEYEDALRECEAAIHGGRLPGSPATP